MSAVARLLLTLAVVVLLFLAYIWLVLSWSYSEGERAGYVQKLSRKGWLCKTWEGELALVTMPGTVSEKFVFSLLRDRRQSPRGADPHRRTASAGSSGTGPAPGTRTADAAVGVGIPDRLSHV